MKNGFLILLFFLCFSLAWAQNPRAYRIYNKKGKEVSFDKMIKKLAKNDVVLFGENHNNAIVHWLELRTLKALYKKKKKALAVGAEMFERDTQEFLNAYLTDSISLDSLKSTARPWPNFKTDYLPLLNFTKEKGLRFVATNVPRPYAAIVAQKEGGLDSLEQLEGKEKQWLAKLPIVFDMETPGYKKMEGMMKDHAGPNALNYVKAQALKDATMAESILKNREKKGLFLHFNGNFHSKEHGGIYWYLKKESKRLRVAVVTIVESDEKDLPLNVEETPTEYMIVVPSDMTKTY